MDVKAARVADALSVSMVDARAVPGLDPSLTDVHTLSVSGENGDPDFRIRTYSPLRRTREKLGALLFIHGGAFCVGDLETDHLRCLAYSQFAELVVVNVEYRLAPEYPFPAAYTDCCQAFRWIVEHAASLRVDPTMIGIGGESAGAALAAALVARFKVSGTRPACQLLLFPVLDHRMTTPSSNQMPDTPAWNSVQTASMWRLYLGDVHERGGVSASASPALETDLTGQPPTLLTTAGLDPLRDEGLAFGLRLVAAGVPAEIHNYPRGFHVFDFAVPGAGISQIALNEQLRFLETYIGKNVLGCRE